MSWGCYKDSWVNTWKVLRADSKHSSKVKWKPLSHIRLFVTPVISDSLWPHGLYSPWNSPGQKTGVGSLSLPQGIFPTQGSNPGLPHCRQILYQLSHKGSPRILELVAYPFPRGSSWPRNRTRVSCIAGRFLSIWATREALQKWRLLFIQFLHWVLNLLGCIQLAEEKVGYWWVKS